MSGLRGRLIVVFLAATLVPLALTVWTSIELLGYSLDLAPVRELDRLSKSFERVSREYYQRSRERLKQDAASGVLAPRIYPSSGRSQWPARIQEFADSGAARRFDSTGAEGRVLDYIERTPTGVRVYSRELGIGTNELTREFAGARAAIASSQARNLKRGFILTFIAIASAVWIAGLVILLYFARRITAPVHALTRALRAVGQGELDARVQGHARADEIGEAIQAFNNMAAQMETSRARLIQITRLESWQALARKTAHEVKNSLTPIRLTTEEIAARATGPDAAFLNQAAQIVVDEVVSLERRVRAFSEFAAEPPVSPQPLDFNSLIDDRVSFLKSAHPDVIYTVQLSPERPSALVDPDLLKGILTNLLQNASEAARPGGVVMLRTTVRLGEAIIEVHDSGPGLSPEARSTVFEPTISFKKGGMGLGLSIARKSALLCGGDIALIAGELGGAAFRVSLPRSATTPAVAAAHQSAVLTT